MATQNYPNYVQIKNQQTITVTQVNERTTRQSLRKLHGYRIKPRFPQTLKPG